MEYKIRFFFDRSTTTITFGSEECRDDIFQKITEADWEEPFLIEAPTDDGHNASTVINLPKVCQMDCVNER